MLKLLFVLALTIITPGEALIDNADQPNTNRYELHNICLGQLQTQIHAELKASLVYLNMGSYFDNNNVARKGFAKFFFDQSNEEMKHAKKLIDYVNRRGGRITKFNVDMPSNDKWENVQAALNEALQLEITINNNLHKIHGKAENECKDPHLMDFLEEEFLKEQVESIDQIKRLITKLSKMDNGVGEYLLDKQVLEGKIGHDEL